MGSHLPPLPRWERGQGSAAQEASHTRLPRPEQGPLQPEQLPRGAAEDSPGMQCLLCVSHGYWEATELAEACVGTYCAL